MRHSACDRRRASFHPHLRPIAGPSEILIGRALTKFSERTAKAESLELPANSSQITQAIQDPHLWTGSGTFRAKSEFTGFNNNRRRRVAPACGHRQIVVI
jgi:hypothetical protein